MPACVMEAEAAVKPVEARSRPSLTLPGVPDEWWRAPPLADGPARSDAPPSLDVRRVWLSLVGLLPLAPPGDAGGPASGRSPLLPPPGRGGSAARAASGAAADGVRTAASSLRPAAARPASTLPLPPLPPLAPPPVPPDVLDGPLPLPTAAAPAGNTTAAPPGATGERAATPICPLAYRRCWPSPTDSGSCGMDAAAARIASSSSRCCIPAYAAKASELASWTSTRAVGNGTRTGPNTASARVVSVATAPGVPAPPSAIGAV